MIGKKFYTRTKQKFSREISKFCFTVSDAKMFFITSSPLCFVNCNNLCSLGSFLQPVLKLFFLGFSQGWYLQYLGVPHAIQVSPSQLQEMASTSLGMHPTHLASAACHNLKSYSIHSWTKSEIPCQVDLFLCFLETDLVSYVICIFSFLFVYI